MIKITAEGTWLAVIANLMYPKALSLVICRRLLAQKPALSEIEGEPGRVSNMETNHKEEVSTVPLVILPR